MNKFLLITLTTVFWGNLIFAQSVWITRKIDNKLSLKFPEEPKEIKPGSFLASSADKGTLFVFSIIDTKQIGYDSVEFESVKVTDSFLKNFKSGIKQSLSGFEIDDIKTDQWHNLTTYIITGVNPQGTKIDYLAIVIGAKIYALVTRRNKGIGTEDRDIYFKSVEYTLK
ncbi:MAG: hypothetical protein ABIP28_05845 [Mucilaginibacter sp.]